MDPVGRSEVLPRFYMDHLSVSILYADEHMIDIETILEGPEIFMTFVYSDLVVRHWNLVWERLSHMSTTCSKVWFMIRNFNEIMGNHEKRRKASFRELIHSLPNHVKENCGILYFSY